ncbi:MAG TPA: nucleotide-binding protein [Myxococcales bacterium]|nr:nucleotide-binding protein [Myxococcales bacterium]
MRYLSIPFLALCLTITGCQEQVATPKRQATQLKVHKAKAPIAGNTQTAAALGNSMKLPAGHPPVGGSTAESNQPAVNRSAVTGVVEETIPAGKYIYLKLATAEGETWTAVPKAAVKKGDTATVVGAALMQKFKSKTLGRTFDKIWFGTLKGTPKSAPKANGGTAKALPAAKGTTKATPKTQATGGNAGTLSIAQLHAQGAALAGKTVTVKGKVIKFNAQILGRNWLHLQDGSGNAKQKTHDITVTTNATAAVGDQVTAKGLVILNKDFGAGYKYPIMIEQAVVTR